MSHLSAFSRVIAVPEILSIICGFARTSDCARLSRTCKIIFGVSTAFVWKRVDGRSLLSLIGARQEIRTDHEDTRFKTLVFHIPLFPPIDFSRFDCYAQYVRVLEVYGTGPAPQYYQVEGWDQLTLRVRQGPLLPNLRSILLDSPIHKAARDNFIWIKTFITPSLVEVRAITGDNVAPVSTSPLVADVILDTVAEHCPRLLKLTLFPSRPSSHYEPSGPSDRLLGFLWKRPYHQSLSNLSNLTELTCNVTMLQQGTLSIVSLLPTLRRSSIFNIGDDEVLDLSGLPIGSFPALQELHLVAVDGVSPVSILGISPLMSTLTHLELECGVWMEDFDDADISEWITFNVLSQLKNCPSLLSLAVTIRTPGAFEPYYVRLAERTNLFSDLALEAVALIGVRISDWELNGTRFIKAAWSNVTSLNLPDQIGTPDVLIDIAHLPRLQYLKICLELERFRVYTEKLPICPLHTLESSAYGEIATLPEELEDVANFLLTLFPSLREVIWPELGADGLTPVDHKKFVGFLNRYLKVKKEVVELRTKLQAAGKRE